MAETNSFLVMKALAQLAKNKGGKRKMSSNIEIKNLLNEKGRLISSNDIDSALDVLIQVRYCRYRINTYKQKEYQWYGLTKMGWNKLYELLRK